MLGERQHSLRNLPSIIFCFAPISYLSFFCLRSIQLKCIDVSGFIEVRIKDVRVREVADLGPLTIVPNGVTSGPLFSDGVRVDQLYQGQE